MRTPGNKFQSSEELRKHKKIMISFISPLLSSTFYELQNLFSTFNVIINDSLKHLHNVNNPRTVLLNLLPQLLMDCLVIRFCSILIPFDAPQTNQHQTLRRIFMQFLFFVFDLTLKYPSRNLVKSVLLSKLTSIFHASVLY